VRAAYRAGGGSRSVHWLGFLLAVSGFRRPDRATDNVHPLPNKLTVASGDVVPRSQVETDRRSGRAVSISSTAVMTEPGSTSETSVSF
jgi:hypothetical protein